MPLKNTKTMNSVLATRQNRRANPIARAPGSIDVNTKLDTKFLLKSQKLGHRSENYTGETFPYSDVHNEVFDVVEGEILMGVKKGQARYRGRTSLCFSSANGLPVDPRYLDELVYSGIAVTGYSRTNDAPREQQGFVATFAGLVTMTNSGTHNIFPGDILRVVMPSAKRPANVKGTPEGKVVFGIEPVTQSHLVEVEALVQAMSLKGEQEFAQTIAIVKKMEDMRRFEIGRAMGYARPCQDLVVCLG